MSEIDHRAAAEALLFAIDAMRDNLAVDIPWAEIQAAATFAQVHATLAAGEGDLAERYRRAYAETLAERDELRAAVREYIVDVENGAKYDQIVALVMGHA